MKLLKEDEVKSPYDLREMLWYIIPGATLVILIFFFEFWFATQIRGTQTFDVHEKKNLDSIQILLNSADSIHKINLVRELESRTNLYEMRKSLLDSLHTPVYSALSMTHTPLFESVKGEKALMDNWVLAALYLLLLFTICYILGHLTYVFGTFIYERGLISKGFSYPYLKLLRLEGEVQKNEPDQKKPDEIKASQAFYRGIYFWSAIIYIFVYVLYGYWIAYWGISNLEYYRYLVLLMALVFIFFPIRLKFILCKITDWNNNKEEPKDAIPPTKGLLYWFLCTILITLTFSIYYQFISKQVLISLTLLFITIYISEKFIRNKSQINNLWLSFEQNFRFAISKILRKKFINTNSKQIYNRSKELNDPQKYLNEKLSHEYFFVKWYHFFSNEIDKFSRDYFHTQKEFDVTFIKEYENAFRHVFNRKYNELTRHNYWLSKFFVMENSIYLTQQINFWENIYRFTKSLSASFFLAFLYCSISFMIQFEIISRIIVPKSGGFDKWLGYDYFILILFLIPLFYFFIKVLIVRYYLYVYDNRFNRMILRGFVSIVATKKYNKSFTVKD